MNEIKGKAVDVGGREFIVPKAKLSDGIAVQEIMRRAGAGTEDEALTGMARIVHTLVVRNYPAVTVEELMDLILMESMTETVASVLEAAGLRTGPTSP